MTHYETLGVPRDADAEVIKRAYRRLSAEHHPDRGGGDATRMSAINAAYDVLGDPVKRLRYDTTGESAPSRVENDAEQCIMQLVLQLLDNEAVPPMVDVFAQVGHELRNQEALILDQMQQAQRRRKKIARTMSCLRWRDDGTARRDFMRGAFQQRIDLLLEGDRKAEQHVEMLRLAQRYVTTYQLEPEMSPFPPTLMQFLQKGI